MTRQHNDQKKKGQKDKQRSTKHFTKKKKKGTGYEYDGNVAWVLQVRRAEVVTK
jgi:hypothetical protein